ncbi:MAG: chromosome segregation protein SMC [Nanoarchaeota archaeon]
MTYITKMFLKGFKSFAKPTELEFGKGFSTIIGPNGSGKSNISDGICFVLGKISAKSMRAEKSANLIFNGGKQGSPLKEAEVSIFFDNTKKEFPFDAQEIKLSRIVRQNGQSVYKINGEVRTRQQIIDALSAAKVDPDGHNIILQGDIVHFMEMKTEERREIIEEIAGISVYEDRKGKALGELGKVDGKLNEATIILTEREAYMRELKKDRDQAMRYKDLEKNIQSNKATFLHLQIDEKEEKKKEIEGKIKQCEADIAVINKKIQETKEAVQAKKNELEEIANLIEEKGEKEAIALQKELEVIKTEAVRNRERLNTCKNEIAKVQERKKQLELTFQDLEKTIKDLQRSKQEREDRRKALATKEERIGEELKIFKEKQGNAASAEDLEKAEKEVESIEENITSLQDERQTRLQKKFQVDAQIAQCDEKIKNVQSIAKEFDFDKIKKTLETAEKSLRKALNDDSFLAAQLGDTKEQLLKKEEELFVLQARDAGRKSSAMSNIALKKILSLQNEGIYGTVAQLGVVDKKYALALDVAAGSRMNNIVVKDDKTAAECIALLKRDKLGVATFLPINKIKTRTAQNISGKGVIGNALDLVSFDHKFKDIFSFVLGGAVVVDNIDTARRIGIGKAKLVTLEGDLAEMSGAMIGGYRHKNQANIGFQEKQASGTMREFEESIDRLQKVKAALEKRRVENQENIDKYRQEKSVLEGELIKAEKSVGSIDIESIRSQKENLMQDKIFHDLKLCEQELKNQENTIDAAKKTRDKLRENAKDMSHPDIALQREKIEERRQKIREEMIQVQTEIKNIDTQILNIYEPEKEKTQQIMKGHEKEIESFVKEAKKLEELLKNQEKSLKEKEQQELKFQRDYKDLFTKRTKISEEMQKRESSISVEDMKIKEIEHRMNERSINRAKMVGELEGLYKEFEDFKGIPLRKQIAEEKLKEEIKKFEEILQQMGNVNLRALEVYEHIVKEYDELLKKIEKLKTEKDDVLSMIDDIESRKKDLFMETFNVIAKNFTRIFSSLSTKGEAFLELEDKQNPLSAGIDIKVRILGNKFLDIKSLSGGEKTMAATAFIFAIQEHQPGSFYILDEVDAALDKRNSELLSKLISKYSQKAQYILISHNDAVISEAERIYGVSMQQTGMSKVISLKI